MTRCLIGVNGSHGEVSCPCFHNRLRNDMIVVYVLSNAPCSGNYLFIKPPARLAVSFSVAEIYEHILGGPFSAELIILKLLKGVFKQRRKLLILLVEYNIINGWAQCHSLFCRFIMSISLKVLQIIRQTNKVSFPCHSWLRVILVMNSLVLAAVFWQIASLLDYSSGWSLSLKGWCFSCSCACSIWWRFPRYGFEAYLLFLKRKLSKLWTSYLWYVNVLSFLISLKLIFEE